MNPRLMKAPCVRPEKASEMSLKTLDDPHRTLIKPYRILVEFVECLESLYGGPEVSEASSTSCRLRACAQPHGARPIRPVRLAGFRA